MEAKPIFMMDQQETISAYLKKDTHLSENDVLRSFDPIELTRFSIWCAKQVLPIVKKVIPSGGKAILAIESAENWANNPTEENAYIARIANSSAWSEADFRTVWPGGYDLSAICSIRSAANAFSESTETSRGAAYWAREALGCQQVDLLRDYLLSKVGANTISLFELNRGL